MPHDSAPVRIEAIRSEGAQVRLVSGGYDLAVTEARRAAGQNAWQIISDTSWAGYDCIPRWVMAGYRTLFEEAHEQAMAEADVVMIPGGVGALAATAAWFYRCHRDNPNLRLIAVEPLGADCLRRSALDSQGQPITVETESDTIMAGLNCGTPSPVAWPLIRDGFDAFLSISDDLAIEAMRTYYRPRGRDPRIIAGESGAATLAGLLALCGEGMIEARQRLRLDSQSTVLLINTEGDTDPVRFREIVR